MSYWWLTTPTSQRVCSYGSPKIYLLQAIAAFAAVTSGVALALVNLVIGNFMSLLSDFSFSDDPGMPSNFMSAVSTTS
jgi:ATP-binding cassette, subfamily B (MDR/TAP), member 1